MKEKNESALDLRGAVEFRRVSKKFGEHVVLDGVSFQVERGTAFCLLGKSGVGKSVTLKLTMGLLSPDSGDVLVQGERVHDLRPETLSALRRRMGFLFQQAALFDSISVGENVAFPLRRGGVPESEVRPRAEHKLEQVGLKGRYDAMPSELSGGMKKRAGLARALAMEPEVLLVDESSAGLDPITSAEIDELLLRLKSGDGTTMMIVTHNIPSARRVGDRLALLEGGKIQSEGTVEDLEHSDDELVRSFMQSGSGG
ncbi:MAG TPA: ATP-binding cassette domain-containing protein [Vicinamibacteria bacterium]|nr:ATP-binding cassette domain-containing protein [Vicinamibacteria bacterium]